MKLQCTQVARKSVGRTLDKTRRYQEDHIAQRGMNLLSRCNPVHKFIPMPQAIKIPDAKEAVEIMGNLEKIPAWHLTKVRNKNEVIAEARNNGIQ